MGFQVSFHNVTDFLQVGTKDLSFLEERSPHWEYIPGTLSVSGPSYFNNTPNIGIAQASVMLDRVKGKLTWIWIELSRGHARWAWRWALLTAFLFGKCL